LRWCGISTM